MSILDDRGEEIAYAEAEENFVYKKKMLVTTLIGETDPEIADENKNFDVKDGPWGDCGGLEKWNGWFLTLIIRINCMFVVGQKHIGLLIFQRRH